MADKIEPIIHKLTEAIPEPEKAVEHPQPERPGHGPQDADLKQHNAEVQPETKDRMVDIGRGQQTKGRG